MILTGMMKYSQSSQNSKFAISLQYLKKEFRNGGHSWLADKCQSFYKSILSFLMEVARHVQNTQNMKLVIFLQYIKKNCCNYFVFYCDAKHSDILQGPVMFIVPCYASSDMQLGSTWRKPFSDQKTKLCTARIITCDVQNSA